MSTEIRAAVAEGPDCGAHYSVEIMHGCRIIRGAVPLSEMARLLKSATDGTVIDPQLTERLDAIIVYGRPEDCERYRRHLGIGQPPAEYLKDAPIEDKIADWFAHGEIGVSSKAIALRLLGRSPEEVIEQAGQGFPTHPSDPDDFRRCHELIERVPEIRARLPEMAAVSPIWTVLVEHWDELTGMLTEALASSDDTPFRNMRKKMVELGC